MAVRLACLAALMAALAVQTAAATPGLYGQVAFAASPAPAEAPAAAPGQKQCWLVEDYSPFRTCKASTDPAVCGRNYGVYESKDICCSPGVAFPEGCSERPAECWVVDSFSLRTCARDDRKCLQGSGVYASEAACCAKNAAFPDGCAADVAVSEQPCFIVASYYPARTCRATRVGCDRRDQKWATAEQCCGPNGAFGQQGCSTFVPSAPCYVVDTYEPRRCRREGDAARCSRGWGVYQSEEVCCAPGAAFSEGCSPAAPAAPAAGAATTAPAPAAAPAATTATTTPAVAGRR